MPTNQKYRFKGKPTKYKLIVGLSLLAFFYFLVKYFFEFNIVVCPSKVVYGLPCPSCGTTRAFISLTKGDFFVALSYNFLWVVLIPIGIVLLVEKIMNDALPQLFSLKTVMSYIFWFSIALQWIVNLVTNK